MSQFNPQKLSVRYLAPATEQKPVDARKYTLTHLDETGELFLSIGCVYDYSSVNKKFRDEVLAEWLPQMGQYVLKAAVYVSGGEFDEKTSKMRYMIFQREMDLALKAIIYGDRSFFTSYPWLLDSPIYVQFESVFPQFSKIIYYGTPRQYLNSLQQPVI
ncbi:staygreen family protein [Bacillus infantis]|uniref:staygreen family protein n=1 Tax=Bacillus infantis TaxID=324767 RepID=UPI003CE92597